MAVANRPRLCWRLIGNDNLTSGFGNDNYTWPPGTLTDSWDGGAGYDTVTIIGNDSFAGAPAGDSFLLTANGTRVLFQRTNLVRFAVDLGTTESVVLNPGAGDDVVTVGDLTGVANLRKVTVNGALGNDVMMARCRRAPRSSWSSTEATATTC